MKSLQVEHFPSLPSTNTYLKEQAQLLPKNKISVVHVDEQSHGRGQFQRNWLSPKGNLYFSYAFFIPRLPKNFPLLSIVASTIIAESIDNYGVKLNIHWPNDLYAGGGKCGGILCESLAVREEQLVIIGLGLNLNYSFEQEKNLNASSFFDLTQEKVDIQKIFKKIIKALQKNIPIFFSEGFAPFANKFEQIFSPGKKLYNFNTKNGTLQASILKVTPEGHFVVENKKNEEITIKSFPLSSV
ncbi:hypothetical protein AB751O23_AE_00190 [Chlamydiales bacterium SCGC AB-751-O23]|jgi:BirA family transcriptional regulator, biotin operon repressor / biotin---[acetyl-CoA-carboxylase] ligase|nr:hypothetical protein AB751O23_AE_00190 [Chlamydiales bacterium SCGC AB-751-O23]